MSFTWNTIEINGSCDIGRIKCCVRCSAFFLNCIRHMHTFKASSSRPSFQLYLWSQKFGNFLTSGHFSNIESSGADVCEDVWLVIVLCQRSDIAIYIRAYVSTLDRVHDRWFGSHACFALLPAILYTASHGSDGGRGGTWPSLAYVAWLSG